MSNADEERAIRCEMTRVLSSLNPEKRSDGVAGRLATLRKNAATDGRGAARAWEDAIFLDDSHSPRITVREQTANFVLGLFAVYQQGCSHFVHASGDASEDRAKYRLGRVIGSLGDSEHSKQALIKGLERVVVADAGPTIYYRMRSLIQLLKSVSSRPPVDFVQLAVDLGRLQSGGQAAEDVRFRWGRELHSSYKQNNTESEVQKEGK